MSVGVVSRVQHDFRNSTHLNMFSGRRTASFSSAYCEKCLVQIRDSEDQWCQDCRQRSQRRHEGRNFFGDYLVPDMLEALGSVINVSPTSSTTSAPSYFTCNACEESSKPASAKCLECNDYLCESCVVAHRVVRVTKDHPIQPLSPVFEDLPSTPVSTPTFTTPQQQQQPAPAPIGNNRRNSIKPASVSSDGSVGTDYGECPVHASESLCFYCYTCSVGLCHACILGEHHHHNYVKIVERFEQCKPTLEELIGKSQVEMHVIQLSVEEVSKMSQQISTKKDVLITEIRQTFKQHIQSLLQKESELIAQVKNIADVRTESLAKQMENLQSVLQSCCDTCKEAEEVLKEGNKKRIMELRWKLADKLSEKSSMASARNPVEDDSFILKTNLSAAQAAMQNICVVTTAPYAPMCSAVGDCFLKPKQGRLYNITVCTRDRSGNQCLQGGERLFVQLKASTSGAPVQHETRDNSDGTYLITFRPYQPGEHQLVIAVRGQHIKGSPFSLIVENGSEYGRFGVVTKIFGSEGSEPGQFCRSWGICADQMGNIIVGDRSNHRVQIFDSNGGLKHCFGSEGVHPGQFNRPAGVAVTRDSRVVVADKDNHRIQVLQYDGKFVFMFGSKGSNDGQMIYPYDVAVNQSDGRIAVTDSGNHRLLIFTPEGVLIGKFGYKGYLCGHFDSPRGIVFNEEGHLIVSDFNVHHILVIHQDGTTARILGSQGSGNGQFMRPQGLTVDQMGNFVIADTRNHRIVIMHPNGQFIAKFGSQGSGPGQFDRPTSVAVLPHGRIAVLDFGNSRIQIF